MTLPGGGADKLGNRYESFWAVGEMLKVMDGLAIGISFERPGFEGEGVEFVVETTSGKVYWQVKRRNRNQWTLTELSKNGVLNTMYSKLADTSAKVNFASTHQCDALRVLTERARASADLVEFEEKFSNEQIKRDFSDLEGFWSGLSKDVIFHYLQRIVILNKDEHSIERDILGDLVERVDGDPELARTLLADYVLKRLHHQLVTTQDLWSYLDSHGLRQRAWHNDPRLLITINETTDRYTRNVQHQKPYGVWLQRPEVQHLMNLIELESPDAKQCVVISGEAGVGKSGVIHDLIQQLKDSGYLVLAFRLDRLERCSTPKALGEQLGLPESLIYALNAVAQSQKAVLVIDQLDAVSFTSGRNPEFYECVQELIDQASKRLALKVVIASRKFDLYYDSRFRKLVDQHRGVATEFEIKNLDIEQVKFALGQTGLDHTNYSARQLQILASPLNLTLFIEGLPLGQEAVPFANVQDLYSTFWERKKKSLRLKNPSFEVEWIEVIDFLCNQMSQKRLLSIPTSYPQLDRLERSWQAMVSEHVLILDNQRLAFFHEGFFDYCFARLFHDKGISLFDFLVADEQHLFRRGQVRQILNQLRESDYGSYIKEIENILFDSRIRYHIRDSVYDVLRLLKDPRKEEWDIVAGYFKNTDSSEYLDTYLMVRGSKAWFDLLNDLGVLELWGQSSDPREIADFWGILGGAREHSPAEVVLLTKPFLYPSSPFFEQLVQIYGFGGSQNHRDFFEVFKMLLPNIVSRNVRSEFWYTLDNVASQNPDWACEALEIYLHDILEPKTPNYQELKELEYPGYVFPQDYHATEIMTQLWQRVPILFLECVIPFIEKVATKTASPNGRLFRRDGIWDYLYYHQMHRSSDFEHELLDATISAMKSVAQNTPTKFRELLVNLRDKPLFIIQFIILRASEKAHPDLADEVIEFAIENLERLEISFVDGEQKVIHDLLLTTTPFASMRVIRRLEVIIQSYKPEIARLLRNLKEEDKFSEKRKSLWYLKSVGKAPFGILSGILTSRLSPYMLQLKQVWQRKFPDFKISEPLMWGGVVPSPIPQPSALRMGDKQWLKAIQKYDSEEVRDRRKRREMMGGVHQLASVLQEAVKQQPERFARFCLKLPSTVHSAYFDAIIMGLREVSIERDLLLDILKRCHALEGNPCGRWLMSLISRNAKLLLITDVEILEMVAWYAVYDPSPQKDYWRENKSSRGNSENIVFDGINSVRGAAAEAIEQLIYADKQFLDFFQPVLEIMVQDSKVAVRSCVAQAITPILNFNRDLAVELFLKLCDGEEPLLASYHVHQFLYYSLHTHYKQLAALLGRMLAAKDDEISKAGAKWITFASLSHEAAIPMAQFCLKGEKPHRIGAAEIYAANCHSRRFKEYCEDALRQLFFDDEVEVRDAAADCFRKDFLLVLNDSMELINLFLQSPAFDTDRHLLFALNEYAFRIPDIALSVCEEALERVRGKSTSDQSSNGVDGHWVSELLLRYYAQQLNDPKYNSDLMKRTLDAVDQLMKLHIFQSKRLLEKFDR